MKMRQRADICWLDLGPVHTRKNGTVPFGAEPFHIPSVNAERFQMVPGVITVEEECVLNHKYPVLFGIGRLK